MSEYGEIIAAIISAVGTIAAAFIAVLFAGKIVKEESRSYFHSYSDKTHNVADIIEKAQSDIFIVVIVGDRFLNKYKKKLEKCLSSGIEVRYLLANKKGFHEQEDYMSGADVDEKVYMNVLKKLNKLKKKYPDLLDVRAFHTFLTASYIGIDIWPPPPHSTLPNSVIQIMLYQYHVLAENSPITYLSPKADKNHYTSTVDSIKAMWESAEELLVSKSG